MKHLLRTNTALKIIAFLLALLALTGGFWASFLTLAQWDSVWNGADYRNSQNYYACLYQRTDQLYQLLYLLQQEKMGELPYLDRQNLEELRSELSAESTNFRFRALDNATGALIYTNLSDDTLEDMVSRVLTMTASIDSREPDIADYITTVDSGTGCLLHIALSGGGSVILDSEREADVEQAAQYGWFFDGQWWEYDADADSRPKNTMTVLALEYGVTKTLDARDEFWRGELSYQQYAQYLPAVAIAAPILDALGILLTVFLCLGAGRRRETADIVLSPLDRIPLDLLAGLDCFAIVLLVCIGDAWLPVSIILTWETVTVLGIISLGITACILPLLLSIAVRVKARSLWSNTLLRRGCRLIVRGCKALCRFCRRAVASLPLTRRVVLGFALYLLGSLITTPTVILVPFYQGFVLYLLCRWTIQWKQVQEGTAAIVGGDPEHKIDTEKFYPDLAAHARQLNDLGGAISSAVDERMKSERFRSELITNVSHDLKTPLTSIINYVDLLKKEELDNPRAQEYLEVLDRKSQRLKKLTEDLVEASKASTGSLSVNRERLGMVQLVRQAMGEFEEKFSQKNLTPVAALPENEVYICADGRHLWRVLDNLLSNCCKYTLEGTRVYLDVRRWDGQVMLTIKNISAQPLNIPPDRLMERFVRGEESRTTEGSGLGLSIARSLTELQGGTFRLEIDGDLFKAVLAFPEDALT